MKSKKTPRSPASRAKTSAAATARWAGIRAASGKSETPEQKAKREALTAYHRLWRAAQPPEWHEAQRKLRNAQTKAWRARKKARGAP